ncbi:MAG: 2-C-methyl-D-erythritol 2,4-cyclodiphosphate synthase [Lentisphaeria bacterium]|jgi:2-C-methyl-D-erythritol 2,4-cyclodiphosphate synthase|nr:2-C-methyl-D-erythritol 2,4-cyclodiphosphate synthase [Lentisphaeria bacterium]
MADFRIGNGIDVHRLVSGRRLFLCGVEIPFELGLEGHSDADVALHALADALLGAVAHGDIGRHFPDSDPRYLNADSFELLRRVWAMEVFSTWRIGNIDLTVVAQRPKIAPFVPRMRERIASAFGIDVSLVSVKGTTTEKLGFTGRGEGIAAFCTVLLRSAEG